MREKKIRNLIERQNSEEKEAVWRRIEAELGEEHAVEKPKLKRSPKFWKILSACTSFAVILILGLGLGLGFGLNKNPDVSQTNPPAPGTEFRYCDSANCEFGDSQYTLKEYAEVYGIELLYLNWYDETEDYGNCLYRLRTSGEPVCFEEHFVTATENYVFVYVTDNRTEMEFLTWHDADTGEEAVIRDITVYYRMMQTSKMNFEYKGYRYYIELDIDDFDYLCQIAEQMLSNA